MWGIVPAAGNGTRIQPLAFSKELLPVGSRFDGDTECPRAVSEYLVDRMLRAGADRICFVISPWKSDILQYYGARIQGDVTLEIAEILAQQESYADVAVNFARRAERGLEPKTKLTRVKRTLDAELYFYSIFLSARKLSFAAES